MKKFGRPRHPVVEATEQAIEDLDKRKKKKVVKSKIYIELPDESILVLEAQQDTSKKKSDAKLILMIDLTNNDTPYEDQGSEESSAGGDYEILILMSFLSFLINLKIP